MAMEYVNRRGDRYFVMQGKTKTGKPKFWCTKRAAGAGAGVAVERLPDGFEIHERPEDGLVSVRRIRPSRVQPFEREFLARRAAELAHAETLVEIEDDALVVYATDASAADRVGLLEALLGGMPAASRQGHLDWIARHATYSPMLRFSLQDEDQRLFGIERWCFLGSIDRWVYLHAPLPLDSAASAYLPHLGQESFFELI